MMEDLEIAWSVFSTWAQRIAALIVGGCFVLTLVAMTFAIVFSIVGDAL